MLLFLLPCHCFDCPILRVASVVSGDYVLMIMICEVLKVHFVGRRNPLLALLGFLGPTKGSPQIQ